MCSVPFIYFSLVFGQSPPIKHVNILYKLPTVDSNKNLKFLKRLEGQRIAILPFSSSERMISWQYADEFSLFFSNLNRFQLIEKFRVEEIFRDMPLRPDSLDEKTAMRIGKMLGAKAIIHGVITKDFVSVRLVDTDDGICIWNARILTAGNSSHPINVKLNPLTVQHFTGAGNHSSVECRRYNIINLIATLARAAFGLKVIPPSYVDPRDFIKLGLSGYEGVIITDFLPKTKARAAGVLIGDLVIGVDNTPIFDVESFLLSVVGKKPGDRVIVSIQRNGKIIQIPIKLIPRDF